ncbi:MAG: molybdopterin-guanine dinucleotide biosynthesis protein B [candidate division KSB1 bacterium]|nr:molybdopterin-guanine dinucleotide biosynthesis protein B [candidate division KSB1 bacterium]
MSKYGPKALAICGPKKSGKTSLICQLVRYLRRRSVRVAVVKHTVHTHFLDTPGSDTDRYRMAGALATGLVMPQGYAHFRYFEPQLEPILHRHFEFADLVLLEGFGSSPLPKLILRPSWDPDYAASVDPATVLGILDEPGADLPSSLRHVTLRLAPDNVEALADWLMTHFLEAPGTGA